MRLVKGADESDASAMVKALSSRNTLATFLVKHCHLFPPWLKIVCTLAQRGGADGGAAYEHAQERQA